MKNEYSFLSTDNETMIHITEWVPDQEVVGILVIAHGITEHMGVTKILPDILTLWDLL